MTDPLEEMKRKAEEANLDELMRQALEKNMAEYWNLFEHLGEPTLKNINNMFLDIHTSVFGSYLCRLGENLSQEQLVYILQEYHTLNKNFLIFVARNSEQLLAGEGLPKPESL